MIRFIESKVPAGFPSPAADYLESTIDLNEILIPRPAATKLLTMPDNALQQEGINRGDLLIIDQSLLARQHNLVLAQINGESIIGRIRRQRQHTIIENNAQQRQGELIILGVITWVIHHL